MREETTFSWSMAIMHAVFYTLAVLGINFVITAKLHPTDTWEHMDFMWVVEAFIGILVVLIVFSIQRTTEIFDRFIYLIIFTAFVIMCLATFEQKYDDAMAEIVKGIVNDTTNPISSFLGGWLIDKAVNFQKAFNFALVIGKAIALEFFTLLVGHFSGLVRVTVPEKGHLYSRRYKIRDDWNY